MKKINILKEIVQPETSLVFNVVDVIAQDLEGNIINCSIHCDNESDSDPEIIQICLNFEAGKKSNFGSKDLVYFDSDVWKDGFYDKLETLLGKGYDPYNGIIDIISFFRNFEESDTDQNIVSEYKRLITVAKEFIKLNPHLKERFKLVE